MKPPHIKEQRQKEIRKIYKRSHEIWEEKKALGYEKLDKPIRHGWYKEIVITGKVSRYKNEEVILEVFDKVEKEYWGRTKKEADKVWFNHVSDYYIYRDFPTLSRKQFNKLSDKAKSLCTSYRFKNYNKKWRTRFYIRIPKNAYKIKYTRAYITHRKRIDPKLEREDAWLENQLLKSGYYNLDPANWNWGYYWNLRDYKQEKLKTKRHLKALKNYAIEDVINETISWERN